MSFGAGRGGDQSAVHCSSDGVYFTKSGELLALLTDNSFVAGPGISITGGGTIINNTGVLTVTAGTSISLTGTAQNPIVNNTGVLTATAGTDVTLTGTAQNPIVNVGSAATSIVAGNSIKLTGTSTAPIINQRYIGSPTPHAESVPVLGGLSESPTWVIGPIYPALTDSQVGQIQLTFAPPTSGAGGSVVDSIYVLVATTAAYVPLVLSDINRQNIIITMYNNAGLTELQVASGPFPNTYSVGGFGGIACLKCSFVLTGTSKNYIDLVGGVLGFSYQIIDTDGSGDQ